MDLALALAQVEERELTALLLGVVAAVFALRNRELLTGLPGWRWLAASFGFRCSSYVLTVIETLVPAPLGTLCDACEHLFSLAHALCLLAWVVVLTRRAP